MTKERIKTALLISLFMVSIFLANQIWIELPDSFFPSFGDDLYHRDSKDLFSDIVSPEKYLVNFNGNKHTVLYSDGEYELWEKGRTLLLDILSSQNLLVEEVHNKELNSYREGLSLDYFFSEKLHLYILSKTLEVDIPNSVYDRIEKIDNIHIGLGKEAFIVFTDGDIHLKISSQVKISGLDNKINSIRRTINNIREKSPTQFYTIESMFQEIDNQQYIPINMNYSLPIISINSEININNEDGDSFARYFFNNLEYARPFVEANGTIIYVYNQEVLKIYKDGMVEYSNINEETVRNRELYRSLDTAIDFITNHMGWPPNSYLKSIEPIEFEESRGYRFRFMYKIEGAEIMLENEYSMKAPIEIEVFNDYVKSYKRLVRLPVNSVAKDEDAESMLSIYRILSDKTNYEYIKSKYMGKNNISSTNLTDSQIEKDILSSIDKVYLAYIKSKSRKISSDVGLTLTPVWVIEIDGITFMFDVYEGTKVIEF